MFHKMERALVGGPCDMHPDERCDINKEPEDRLLFLAATAVMSMSRSP